jgi:hypothetical protein
MYYIQYLKNNNSFLCVLLCMYVHIHVYTVHIDCNCVMYITYNVCIMCMHTVYDMIYRYVLCMYINVLNNKFNRSVITVSMHFLWRPTDAFIVEDAIVHYILQYSVANCNTVRNRIVFKTLS